MTLDLRLKLRRGEFHLDIAIHLAKTRVLTLFGPSGSGKSSILDCVAGLLRPDEGHIRADGAIFFDSEDGICLAPQHRHVGLVPNPPSLFPHLNVRANLLYGWRRTRVRSIEIGAVLSVLGLQGMLPRPVDTLSAGERQRVAIGRALLSQPRLLLMDEPTANLDQNRRREIQTFLLDVTDRFGIPLVYVTHDRQEAEALSDHVAILSAGKVQHVGSAHSVFRSLRTERGEAATVLDGIVSEVHAATGLMVVAVGDTIFLTAPAGNDIARCGPIGSGQRLRIAAHHVAIAIDQPRGLSIENVWQASISRIEEPTSHGGQIIEVTLYTGLSILAQLVPERVSQLGLRPGQPVWALVHSASVIPLSVRHSPS